MAKVNQYLVVGFKKIDYTKQRGQFAGQEVHGCEYYLQPIDKDEDVTGDQFDVTYINDKYSSFKPAVGVTVRKLFNQWGKVEDLAEI